MTTESSKVFIPQMIAWIWEIGTALDLGLPDKTAWSSVKTFEEAAMTATKEGLLAKTSRHRVLGNVDVICGYNELFGLLIGINTDDIIGTIKINQNSGVLQVKLFSLDGQIAVVLEINSVSEFVRAKHFEKQDESDQAGRPEFSGVGVIFDLLYKNLASIRRALRTSQDKDAAKLRSVLQDHWQQCIGAEPWRYVRQLAFDHQIGEYRLLDMMTMAGFKGVNTGDDLLACGLFYSFLPTEDWFDPTLPKPDAEAYRQCAETTGEIMSTSWGSPECRKILWILHILSLGRISRPRNADYYIRRLLKLVGVEAPG